MTTQTKSQIVAADVAALLRARTPLIWIVTREEARVEGYLIEAAAAAGYETCTWDVGQGAVDIAGAQVLYAGEPVLDPDSALGLVSSRARATEQKKRGAWIMRDLPSWLEGQPGAKTLRTLRNLARQLPGTDRDVAQAVVVVSPKGDIPAELAGHTTVIEWPLPDRTEIAAILDAAIASLPETDKEGNALRANAAPNGVREAAIDAAVGLNGEEAAGCYAKSLVQLRRIDPTAVSQEKKRVVSRERVLEWHDPLPGGMDAVGGLENLKGWIGARKSAYTPAARAYGLPAPKGFVLVGVPGCGKTLTAKATATGYGVPLLRLDLGALKSKFVGESEGNLRKAFKVIEAIGRCVVWIDEIEKALQGSASGGASDGGVSSDALGAILSWMQERSGEAFVIATANDVSSLPPELLRKGRFDEVFFVDLPNTEERVSVLKAALRSHGRGKVEIDFDAVAKATDTFTGSEIASLVPDALFAAFGDGTKVREIGTDDLLRAVGAVVPLAKTAPEKIAAIRKWGNDRARPATLVAAKAAPTETKGRQIEV